MSKNPLEYRRRSAVHSLVSSMTNLRNIYNYKQSIRTEKLSTNSITSCLTSPLPLSTCAWLVTIALTTRIAVVLCRSAIFKLPCESVNVQPKLNRVISYTTHNKHSRDTLHPMVSAPCPHSALALQLEVQTTGLQWSKSNPHYINVS